MSDDYPATDNAFTGQSNWVRIEVGDDDHTSSSTPTICTTARNLSFTGVLEQTRLVIHDRDGTPQDRAFPLKDEASYFTRREVPV